MNDNWDGQTRRSSDAKIDRILLLLEDSNIGLCGRVNKNESAIRALEKWRSWLTGAYVAAGMFIGAWLEKK